MSAIAVLGGLVLGQDLPIWIDTSDGASAIRIRTDAVSTASWPSSLDALRGARLQVDVEVDGAPLPATEATAVTATFLDAAQAWAHAERGDVLDAVLAYTSASQNRSVVPSYTLYYPFTVVEGTRHADWLLRGGTLSPGLDDVDLRTRLWRDTLLDLALLGSLRTELGREDGTWLDEHNDARMAAWAGGVVRTLQQGSGVLTDVTDVPDRLVEVVTLAQQAGVSGAALQRALDHTVPAGLHVRGGRSATTAVAPGSPFANVLRYAQEAGLGLDLVGLVSRLSADAFEAMALELALSEAADARLRFLEDLVDRGTCSPPVQDPALCEGIQQARSEFDLLRDAMWRGIVAAFTDAESVVDYAALSSSVVGHVAALTHHPAVALAAAKVSAGILVYRTVASIADEGEPLRRAFLLAHLNHLLIVDPAPVDPRATPDRTSWARNVEHLAMSQQVEWAYFAYLHDGYSGRFGDGTYALHRLTQAIHQSRSAVYTADHWRTVALDKLTSFEPLSRSVSIAVQDDTTPPDPTCNDRLEAWGRNSHGQTDVPPVEGVRDVHAGLYHALAILDDGSLVTWGRDDAGQGSVPAELPPGPYVAIAAGFWDSHAATEAGTLYSWGRSVDGVHRTDVPGLIRMSLPGIRTVHLFRSGEVRYGGVHLNDTRQVDPYQGQILDADSSSALALFRTPDGLVGRGTYGVPDALRTATDVVVLDVGGEGAALVHRDGTASWWGIPGRLDPVIRRRFTSDVTDVAVGRDFVAILTAEGRLDVIGYDRYGVGLAAPPQARIRAIEAGYDFLIAIVESEGCAP